MLGHVFFSYRLTNGAAVRLTGKLVPSPGVGQEKELLIDLSKDITSSYSAGQPDRVHILGKCDPEVGPCH
jgi:asparaginyl-tRNA synthetase